MKLDITIDDRTHTLDIPETIMEEGEELFQKMDRDMDRGWQMGPEFVEKPDQINRCQIVADRLLVSLSAENQTMIMLMAGYILKRMPDVTGVEIDTAGEMLNTRFIHREPESRPANHAVGSGADGTESREGNEKLTKLQAMEQAGKDVSRVYKSGRGYKFALRNGQSGEWTESPLIESEKQANDMRMHAIKQRYNQLLGTQDVS